MTVHAHSIGKEVSPVIAQPWYRYSKFMQWEAWQAPYQAQGLTFESIYRRRTALLTIAQAALEDVWEFTDGRPCALLILDESACIFSRYDDPQTVEQLAELGLRDDSYRTESIIDSCALSLATVPDQSTEASSGQHSKQALYP